MTDCAAAGWQVASKPDDSLCVLFAAPLHSLREPRASPLLLLAAPPVPGLYFEVLHRSEARTAHLVVAVLQGRGNAARKVVNGRLRQAVVLFQQLLQVAAHAVLQHHPQVLAGLVPAQCRMFACWVCTHGRAVPRLFVRNMARAAACAILIETRKALLSAARPLLSAQTPRTIS